MGDQEAAGGFAARAGHRLDDGNELEAAVRTRKVARGGSDASSSAPLSPTRYGPAGNRWRKRRQKQAATTVGSTVASATPFKLYTCSPCPQLPEFVQELALALAAEAGPAGPVQALVPLPT